MSKGSKRRPRLVDSKTFDSNYWPPPVVRSKSDLPVRCPRIRVQPNALEGDRKHLKHNEDAEVTETNEDQEVVEAGVDAEHSEHWGAGTQADARHSERLKSATSWRVHSTREVRRMWTMPNRVQGGDGEGKLSRATGGMVIARGTDRTRLHAEMPKRLRETRSKRKVEGSQRRCRGLWTEMNLTFYFFGGKSV